MRKEVGLESIISALTNDYERLFWSDIHTGEIRFLPNEKLPDYFNFLSDDYLSHDEKMRLFANKLVDSSDRAKFMKAMSSVSIIEAFDNEKPVSVRYKSQTKDGDINLYETKLFRAPSENGHLCVVFAIRNVNDLIQEEAKKAVQEEENKTYGIVNALANDYESIFLIDVKTDKMTSYRLNERARLLLPNFDSIKTFEQLSSYIKKDYVPMDEREQYSFDIKRSSIADGLSHGESYKVKHSVVINDSTQNWELKFAYGNEEHSVIVCGIRNIDNVVAQLEEKKHFLQDHARQKAFVDLFADSYLSAYYVNLLDGHYRVYKASSIMGGSTKPAFSFFGNAMVDFSKYIVDENERTAFIESTTLEVIKEKLLKNKEYIYDFRATLDGVNYYFRMRAIKGHDEYHVAIGFSDITKDHEKELKEIEAKRQTAIISSLTSDFELVNYVELGDNADEDLVTNSKLSSVFSLFPEIVEEKSFSKRIDYISNNIVLPDDREEFIEKTRRAVVLPELKKGHPYFLTFRVGFQENAAYYQLKFSPDMDAAGFLKGFVVGIHSIDEQMKREFMSRIQAEENLKTINEQKEQLIEQHAQLEAANNSKTAFLFNMSHDIRTPMNAITGFADLAEKYIDDKEKALDYINKIQTASDHLLNLINEVLDMSRVESGKITSEIATVNIVDLVNEIYLMCKESATSRAIDMTFDSTNVPNVSVQADALHVNRILLNIIGNAVKFTRPNGSIRVSTKLLENTEPGMISIAFVCEDTGIGMSKEFLSHIYDSFSRERTSTNSGVEGTGLGMAIVKKLVDFLGGTIEIKSKVEVGTRVTVNLSFKLSDEQPVNEKSTATKKKAVKSFEDRVCLLVEDNALNREIAKELLEEKGVTVITAENGKIAVDIVKDFKAETFDFVLMDIQMPIMDGLESARRIRQLDDADKLPIIALSANAFAEDRQKSLAAGMNDHVAKPIDEKLLFETLAKYMK